MKLVTGAILGEKMKKRIIVLAVLAALITIGCGRSDFKNDFGGTLSGSANMSMRMAMPEAALTTYGEFNEAAVMHDSIRIEENFGEALAANLTDAQRKLIKQAYVRIRVENLAEADESVSALLNKYSAYSASTVADENSRYYSLRVPAPQYDALLSEMNGMGRLINRSENTEDVTLRYYDLEGRLEMKRTLLRTFQSYLTRARTIEEILSVEARIADLQYDIESTGVQLRHLANRVDYATIDLNLLGPVSTSQAKNETLGERIKQLFGSFGGFLSTTLIVIIGIVIFGIPLALLFAFLFWLLFGKIGLLRKLWGLVRERK